MTDLLRIRASSIGQYLSCPAQFFQQQILGAESKPGLALVAGTAYHAGPEYLHSWQLEKGIVSSLESCLMAIDLAFEEELKIARIFPWDKVDEAREKIRALFCLYYTDHAPQIKPTFVEKELRLDVTKKVGYPIELTGHVDLIDEDHTLIDHKTSARKFSIERKFGYQMQMTVYWLLAKAHGLEPKKNTVFKVAVKTKEPSIYDEPFTVTKGHVDHLYNIIKHIYVQSQHGMRHFFPNRSHTFCSRRWCSFVDTCESDWGGEVRF